MILDIFVIIVLIWTEQYLWQILFIHTLLFFISWRIFLTFNSEFDEVPYYIILWMPLLGMIIFFTLYATRHFFLDSNDIMSDYEQLLSSKSNTEYRRRINYESEMKTMSFLDLFTYIDPEKKKEILIDSHYSLKVDNVKILKKGLESEDKEVQHYSATLLNSKENEFTSHISSLREEFIITHSDSSLDKLIASYKEYINSSLIGEDSIKIFKKEYVDLLLQKVERESYDEDALHSLFYAFLEINDFYNATLINHRIEKEFGKTTNSIVLKLHIQMKKGYISQVVDTLRTLKKDHLDSEPALKKLYKFFITEEDLDDNMYDS